MLVEDGAETSLRTKCTSIECGALKLDLGGGGFSWRVATFCYRQHPPPLSYKHLGQLSWVSSLELFVPFLGPLAELNVKHQ